MVERWFHPGGEGFKALLDDHRSILMEMRRVLERDGDDGVRGMVSAAGQSTATRSSSW